MSVNDASRIVINDSWVMLQIVASVRDNSRGAIYNRNMFTVQEMEFMFKNFFFVTNSATKYVRVFVLGQIFQVSLQANKAMSLPLEWGAVKFDQQKFFQGQSL
jgi:hypothetical protein